MPYSVFEKQQYCAGKVLTLGGNPIDVIEREHQSQTKLCNILENIADSLPDTVDSDLCRQVILVLQRDIPIHRANEEQALFPLLEKRADSNINISEILRCLTAEHIADENAAFEIIESLEPIADGERVKNPNMLGYMLRSFFECYRRHLKWETTILLPIARKFLQPEDLNSLSIKMLQVRQTHASEYRV